MVLSLSNAQTTVNFSCTGGVQNWTVPPCVTSITVNVAGAQGGGTMGGLGAVVTGTFTVTPGQILQINVGCTPTGITAGYNGGGAGQTATSATDPSFGGGGGSEISISPFGPGNQLIIAGGGGGTGGGTEDAFGGVGGCAAGTDGDAPFGVGGVGGTQGAGGMGGAPWSGGTGGNNGMNGGLGFGGAGATDPCFNNSPGGGGGGGYYGGGGGGSDCFDSSPYGGGGGGGGSSLVPVGGGCTAGSNGGAGSVSITYTVGAVTASNNGPYCLGDLIQLSTIGVGTYVWTGPLGFTSTNQNPTIAGATIAMAGDYIVTVTFVGGCVVADTTTVVVGIAPTANVPLNATYCAGDIIPIEILTSVPIGATFDWTNSDPAIGLAPAGTGDIPAFTATNATGAPITATITITPTLGCQGSPVTYTITVNPTSPVIASNTGSYCLGDLIQLSTTGVGTYVWTGPLGFTSTNQSPTVAGATIGMAGDYSVTVTFVGGCVVADTTTVVVGTAPTANIPLNSTYCAGDAVPIDILTSIPIGATFDWTNSDPSIGLAAVGTGDVPAFTATNVSGAPITATIIITPTLGCVGLPVTYTITVNPRPAAPTVLGVGICPNNFTILNATAPGGTYEWYDAAVGGTLLFTGASYTTPILVLTTNYWVQATSNGCISVRTMVVVTVSPVFVVDAGLDATICDGAPYNLNVTPNGAGYIYTWDEPGNLGFSNIFNPIVTPAATTTYTVFVTDLMGCVLNDDVIINVSPVATVTVPLNATYCEGDLVPTSTNLITPGTGTFSWTNSDPSIGLAVSGNGNTPAFTATNPTGSIITATITVTPTLNGCLGIPMTYDIVVNPILTISVTDSNYCDGDAVPASSYVSSPAGATFSWTNSDPSIGLGASGTGNTPAFTAFNNTGATLIVTITVTPTINGCAGIPYNYTITISAPITLPNVVTDVSCNGFSNGQVEVSPTGGTAPFNYIWSDPGIGNTALATNLAGGPLTVAVTDVDGCFQTLNVTISEPGPINYILFDATLQTGCAPWSVEFYNLTDTSAYTNISWDLGNGGGGSLDTISTIYSPGSYDVTLTITDTNNCQGSFPLTNYITAYDNPIADFSFTPAQPTLFDPTISFTDLSLYNIAGWEWNFGGLGNSASPNPDFTFPEDTGSYQVSLLIQDNNGCIDSVMKTVKIFGEYGIYLPTSFTPDGDDLNDEFNAKGFGVSENGYMLMIYDRWGELVFQTQQMSGGWDGTYKGKRVPNGSFAWKIHFTDINGHTHERAGHINVLR